MRLTRVRFPAEPICFASFTVRIPAVFVWSIGMASCVLFYKYVRIAECLLDGIVQWHQDFAAEHQLSGRVLVASEGINGTVCGASDALVRYTRALDARSDGLFARIDWKFSEGVGASGEMFPDFVVKIVAEIVATGITRCIRNGTHGEEHRAPLDISSLGTDTPCGVHLQPEDFHRALLETPSADYALIDVRNRFEYAIGHFEGAIDPDMRSTQQWQRFVDEHIDDLRSKKVYMYCTGGIRCEKTSAYLKYRGCGEVYQLQGGIHRYLEAFPCGGLFQGSNFVFDKRVTQPSPMTATQQATVVGKCTECAAPSDQLDGGAVCTVCRVLVLVCEQCLHDSSCPSHSYYCSAHEGWRGSYHYFVSHFDRVALEEQEQSLQTILVSSAESGKRNHNRRNTLRKKLEQLRLRIAELSAGASAEPYVRRCRCCERPFENCKGRCWGFWRESDTLPVGRPAR